MKLAKTIVTMFALLVLALASAPGAKAQAAPKNGGQAAPTSGGQAATPASGQATASPAKPAAAAAATPAASASAKPAGTAPAKSSKKRKSAKTAASSQTAPQGAAPSGAGGAAPTAAKAEEPPAVRRDPFLSLINVRADSGANLPPGKAGLVIATTRIDGLVQAASGRIAVVSNPQQRVYFLHEGDRLYDGEVEKITLDGVTFKESTKDAFGKPVEREVTKRLYASAGEQQ